DYTDATYDVVGRIASVSNPYRSTNDYTYGSTAYAYDALNRPTKVTLQDGSFTSALYTDNTVTTTDPAGKKRQSTFDSLGRLTQVTEDPGGLGYITAYSYDALSNLTNVTQNSGRQRTFAYDALSRLTRETNPESGTVSYGYDASGHAGDLTSRVAPAPNQTGSATVTTTYSWDALHRLTQKSYSNGTTPTATYVYDSASVDGHTINYPLGRLVKAATGDSKTATWDSYDSMGRVANQWQCTPLNCGATPYSKTFANDFVGNHTSETYSYTTGTLAISYSFDNAARPLQVTSSYVDAQHPATLATIDSSVGYYPNGAIRKMTFGNGLTQTTAFNSALQPCRINVNSTGTAFGACAAAIPSGNLQDFNYGFNLGSSDNGNIMSWTATGQQAFSRNFSYDSLNRIATMQETSGIAEGCKPGSSPSNPYTLSWGYDAWGNRTSQSPSSGTCSFVQNVNTQNQLSSSPYQYDAAGNMTNDGNHTYTYDAENRLTQVDGGATASYIYDALGLRGQKALGTNTADYLYDLSGKVFAEFGPGCGGTGCWVAGAVYLNGQFLAEYYNSTTYFVHSDHLGSTRLLTGVNQAVCDSFDFLPFGEQIAGGSCTNLKFTGDERDSESGLDHTQFRQYSSSLGRWMHPDPAGLAAVNPSNPQSWNRYSYVLNNPLNFVDSLGLYCVYYDDTGSAVESMDTQSNPNECFGTGGDWFPDPTFYDSVTVTADAPPPCYMDASQNCSNANTSGNTSGGFFSQTKTGCFVKGVVAGAATTLVVGAVATVAAPVVGATAVTVGLGALAVAGAASLGWTASHDISNHNWAGVAYDAGSLLGGLATGIAGGPRVARAIDPNATPGWSPQSWSAQAYDSSKGSFGNWMGTGPTHGLFCSPSSVRLPCSSALYLQCRSNTSRATVSLLSR
ncbi:MAG: hypothetical protein DMG78_27595, partial [Acidobacteria bacterium]